MMQRIMDWCVKNHRTTTWSMVVVTVVLMLLAALPTLWPKNFPMLHGAKIDTDPENMLSVHEPVRVFHRDMKAEFALNDMLVVGVVNDRAPDYVFNPATLRDVYALTEYAKTLCGAVIGKPNDPRAGVIGVDMIAPSTVDNVEQGGLGAVTFEWLMPAPPATPEAARAMRDKAMRLPFMKGTLVSEDGQALALYLPLSDKHLSYAVAKKLKEKIATFAAGDQYHITGLPIAEDTFGVEMFVQMAISAPLAMLLIFLLLLAFFRKLVLILSPLILAVVSCIITMALLVATGNTVHIMSSMIPIFIMPIAVLDSIHILSEFFDRYQETKNRAVAIRQVMDTLFTPMLYTSLTTAVGFLSLALTPIPPVQVFGGFIAIGVMVAWVLTVTFIPASVMFISEKSLTNFGLTEHNAAAESHSLMTRVLRSLGQGTFRYAKLILAGAAVLTVVAVWGIGKIVINDNPVKWFEPKHSIRVADRVLNAHFGGTYMGYLALEPAAPLPAPKLAAAALGEALGRRVHAPGAEKTAGLAEVFDKVRLQATALGAAATNREAFFGQLQAYASEQTALAPKELYDAWDAAGLFVSEQAQSDQVFKDPAVLNWMAGLQAHLLTIRGAEGRPLVGKSNSLADLVRTVYRELMEGKAEYYRIPDTREGVAQTVLQYESSHRPQDLAHFVRTDTWRRTSIWIQQKSGDNRDMQVIVKAVDTYLAASPPPAAIRARWFGLTYINVIWQEKMVYGMMISFLGSFAAVWFMMIILFRSALWGFLSMLPLTVTIGLIYGMIGIIGKDYDMPVAVLSALSLGMAVDYAIHFISRAQEMYAQYGSWKETSGAMFGEPARAITRNVIVIGMGFLPLLAAPLVPYQTVGIFIAAILLAAGVATLFLLPALVTLLERQLFPKDAPDFRCRCATCFFAALAGVLTVALNVQFLWDVTWTAITYVSLACMVAAALVCYINGRRKACRRTPVPAPDKPDSSDAKNRSGR
jgi:predicted RND superfamily exporter protein